MQIYAHIATKAKEQGKMETEEPIFNPAGLEKLESMLKKDAVAELARVFIEEAKKTLEMIKVSVQQNDSEMLRHYAHDLKGTSGNFGLIRLHIAAQSLELVAKAGEVARFSALAEPLPALFAEGVKVLEERYKINCQ